MNARAEAGGRFAAGRRVGPYSLQTFLGSGAFGEVWRAEKVGTFAGPPLAVKLPLRGAADLSAVRKEAEVWARVGHHPNVLPMFEADLYDGQAVIVSEYAPDGSLERWLERHGRRAPSIEAALDMMMAILAGLEHLHVREIVHRDLKPDNVLMQGDSPRIADFGLARFVEQGAKASMVAGAPAYMAPEAFDPSRGKSVETDLWSAGVILYELLAGRRPFGSVKAVLTEAPEPLPGTIPSTVREAVLRALHKDPQARFRSAADMRAGLRDAWKEAPGELETRTAVAPRPPTVRTVAVTGSTHADPRRTTHRVRSLLAPYLSEYTTWYCGTVGAVDECTAAYLLEAGQRVIAVGYASGDISSTMSDLLSRHDAPFADAENEQVPDVPGAPSRRDLFFATKADVVVLLWDGASIGTAELAAWLRGQGKDHVMGFVR